MGFNVLLPHVMRNTLPAGILDVPQIQHLSVVTEPGHVQEYSPAVDVRLVDSIQDVEQVRRAMVSILRDREIHYVLAPFEFSVPVAGYLRSYFGLPGMDFETANVFSNKYLMKKRAQEAGLPVTPFEVAYSYADVAVKADRLGWPVVVKPVFGLASLDVAVLADRNAATRLGSQSAGAPDQQPATPLIVERLVDVATEYHCNGVVHDGEVVFAATMKYLAPLLGCPPGLNGSVTLPVDHPDLAGIYDLHARTVRALGMRAGVTHMELLKSRDGQLLVGEIACRPSGGGIPGGIQLQHGVDVWQAFRDTSLGLKPDVAVKEHDGLIACSLLPLKRGRIVRLSTAEDLATIASVVRVDMHRGVGDVMRYRLGSSAAAGIVYLSVRDDAEVVQALGDIADRYVIEVEAEDDPDS